MIFISFSIWRWFSGSNTHPYLLLQNDASHYISQFYTCTKQTELCSESALPVSVCILHNLHHKNELAVTCYLHT